MARTQARIFTSIWHNEEFLAMPSSSQRLFMLALSQETLSFCGVVGYTAKRWAKLAPDTTVASVRKDVAEAARRRFIFVDEDTEEIWVRTFMRYDGIFKSPNLILAMIRDLEAVHSPSLSAAIHDSISDQFPGGFREHLLTNFPKGFPRGFPEGFCRGLEKRYGEPSPEGVSTHAGPPAASGLLPSTSSQHDPSVEGSGAAALVGAAFELLADRRVNAGNGKIKNPGAYRRNALKGLRDDHTETALAIVADNPGLTPAELADRIDNHGTIESPEELLARAAAAQRALADLPDCVDCDNTGYSGGDPEAGKCGCGRLLTAAERASR